MNVLVSGSFQDQARTAAINLSPTLPEVVRVLERLRPETLTSDPMIHRLSGTDEEIYVMRFRNLRIFLTKNGPDVILLGINKG